MDYVRRAGMGMLYADDACIVLRSPQGLAKTVEVIAEVCRAFALTVSAKTTETMRMPSPVHRGRRGKSKQPGKSTKRCHYLPT